MALRVCLVCTTAFAVGLEACPHCGEADHVEQGSERDIMAKASYQRGVDAHGSPYHALPPQAAARGDRDARVAAEEVEDEREQDSVERQDDEGGDDVSQDQEDGKGSSTSSETRPKAAPKNSPDRLSPAPTAASPSKQARTTGSTADSTGTSGRSDQGDE